MHHSLVRIVHAILEVGIRFVSCVGCANRVSGRVGGLRLRLGGIYVVLPM